MRYKAFTIVELLVVIFATAFIMALLLPSLRNSRQQAKAVLCSSNVRQLTLELLLYETDNKSLPYSFNVECDSKGNPIKPLGSYAGNSAFDRKGWWWFNYMSDYSTKSKKTVLWCPSRKIQDPKFDYVLHGNYGVNRSLCKSFDDRQSQREEFVGAPLCSSDIPYPSQTLLVVDSGYSMISWWHATDAPPVALGNTIEDTAYIPGLDINKKKNLWPGQEEDAIDGRHPNKTVNIGFVDGHIDKVKAESLFVEKTADGYRNKSPLWQPK
jgi:prepilin-type processing-associated H-X9-DG protein